MCLSITWNKKKKQISETLQRLNNTRMPIINSHHINTYRQRSHQNKIRSTQYSYNKSSTDTSKKHLFWYNQINPSRNRSKRQTGPVVKIISSGNRPHWLTPTILSISSSQSDFTTFRRGWGGLNKLASCVRNGHYDGLYADRMVFWRVHRSIVDNRSLTRSEC